MSNFEKIGVIFVTGLVAVILAMSFFGTGHEALDREDLALRDPATRDESAQLNRPATGGASIVPPERVDDRRDRAAGTRSSRRDESQRRAQSQRDQRPGSQPRSNAGTRPRTPSWGAAAQEASDMASSNPQRPVNESRRKPTDPGTPAAGGSTFQAPTGGKPSPNQAAGNKPSSSRKQPASSKRANIDDMWAAARSKPAVGEDAAGSSALKSSAGGAQPQQNQTKKQAQPSRNLVNSGGDSRKDASRAKQKSSGSKLDLHRTVYEVRSSDTLSEIAQRELGTAKAWPAIVAANKGLDPKKLRVGQKLTMPSADVSAKYGTSKSSSTKKAEPKRKSLHRVNKGDTLIGIARAHYKDDDRWRDIYNLNRDRISRADRLAVGQVLRLPE